MTVVFDLVGTVLMVLMWHKMPSKRRKPSEHHEYTSEPRGFRPNEAKQSSRSNTNREERGKRTKPEHEHGEYSRERLRCCCSNRHK